jgi:diguanylate cyclase (GGDEF)-like protein
LSVQLPSSERIAALSLLVAALTILVLTVLGVYEVQAEAQLLREVIGAQQAKDGLESLRSRMHELRLASHVHGLTGSADAAREIDRRLVELDADVEYLVERARTDPALSETAGALAEDARAYAFHVRTARSAGTARPETGDALERRARESLDRAIDAQARRIYEGSTAQIRVGENLKFYLSTLLVGSIGILVGLFAVFQYAQSRARAQHERIQRLAHYDPLTELPNRSLLTDRFAQERSRARRNGKGLAVVLFDLDGFKEVNDSLGHAAGDALLVEVARRVRECVRASDTVGRLGGDEFLAILPEAARDGALQVAEKIRAEVSRPYLIAGREARVSASLGVSLHPEHGEDADALMRAADAALYAAKRSGRNRTLFPEEGA